MTAWKSVPLGELADLQAGVGFPPWMQGRLEGELPLAKVGDISRAVRAGGHGLIAPLHHISRIEAAQLRARIFPPGSTVFAKIGEAISQNYRLFTDREAAFDNNVMGAIPRIGVEPRYLFRFLQTLNLYSYSSKTTVPALRKSDLELIPVPLPDAAEQRRIADVLDKADAIRRKRKETIALTEELLRSAFLEMFGDPVTNSKDWPTETIDGLCSRGAGLVDGPFGSSLKPEHYVASGVKVVRNWNIYDDRFDFNEFKYVTPTKFEEIRRSEVLPGDVLITTKGTVGDVCVAPDLGGPAVLSASGTVRLRLPPDESYLPEFVVGQMTARRYKSYLHTFEAGSAQQYLNLSAMRKMRLIRPPKKEQVAFRTFRARVRESQGDVGDAHDRTEALFKALVARAFSGPLEAAC